jgi:hypothetical protein
MSPRPDQPVETKPGNEAVKEAVNVVGNNPEVYVLFKDPKGATIYSTSRDGVESFNFIDRAGQGLHLSAPVSRGANVGNKAQRGLQTADGGDGLPSEALQERSGKVALVDAGGQSLEFFTKQASEKSTIDGINDYYGMVRLSSRQPEPVINPITKATTTRSGNKETEGINSVVLEMSGSDGRFSIEMQNGGEVNTFIHIDSKEGTISIDTPLSVSIKSANIKLDGNVNITGNLMVNGEQINSKDLIVSGAILNTGEKIAEFHGNSNPTL